MGFFKKLFGKEIEAEEQKETDDIQNESISNENDNTEQDKTADTETETNQDDSDNSMTDTNLDIIQETQNTVTDTLEASISTDSTESEISDEDSNVIESQKKKGFFTKLKEGLSKTRKNIMDGIDSVLSSFTKIDEELFEELEETLIMSDIGVETTDRIIQGLRERVKRQRITEVSEIKQLLIDEITDILAQDEQPLEIKSPSIILVIGVNGVGKTTTIGKLASNYKHLGNKVLLAAADTFRAAAIDQLEVWGQRAGIDVIKHQENSDPAAVIFDAIQASKSRKVDILICDTAGRLHNKQNLMEELKKIFRVINREYPEAHKEVFLVLDGTTGQNAMQQAKIFKEAADITGIVLTKLDGTAKGGIVISIKSELKIPVRYIGVGESIDDLQQFSASDFAKALFEK